jgi:uncharacterized protein (DUF924 family)
MSREEEILDFWFEGVDEAGVSGPPSCLARWFGGNATLDSTIRERFGADLESALAGEFDDWAESPRSTVALVILLDQFTRNVFRGEARAFSGDSRALELSRAAVENGVDDKLLPIERYFLYLPFEHAEDPILQERSVRLYGSLAREIPKDARALFKGAVEWAIRHQIVIERFGRFPGRNAALGRTSTAEESAFLEEAPAGF